MIHVIIIIFLVILVLASVFSQPFAKWLNGKHSAVKRWNGIYILAELKNNAGVVSYQLQKPKKSIKFYGGRAFTKTKYIVIGEYTEDGLENAIKHGDELYLKAIKSKKTIVK